MMMPTNLAKKRKGDFRERFPPPPVFKRPDNASSHPVFFSSSALDKGESCD